MLNFGRKLVLADNNGIDFFASLYEGAVKNDSTFFIGRFYDLFGHNIF